MTNLEGVKERMAEVLEKAGGKSAETAPLVAYPELGPGIGDLPCHTETEGGVMGINTEYGGAEEAGQKLLDTARAIGGVGISPSELVYQWDRKTMRVYLAGQVAEWCWSNSGARSDAECAEDTLGIADAILKQIEETE